MPNSSMQEIFAKDARLTIVPSISHGDTSATGVTVPFFTHHSIPSIVVSANVYLFFSAIIVLGRYSVWMSCRSISFFLNTIPSISKSLLSASSSENSFLMRSIADSPGFFIPVVSNST